MDAASATFTTLFSSLCAKLGKPRVDQNTKASWPRRDQQFMWQTLVGERLMSRVAVWAPESLEAAPASDSFAGAAKVDALVLLGDHLNGHVGVVHGGFTAALLDDLFGWAAGIERKRFDPETAVFTANLHVDYKRPMPGNGAYHVTVRADRCGCTEGGNSQAIVSVDGKEVHVQFDKLDEGYRLHYGGAAVEVIVRSPRAARLTSSSSCSRTRVATRASRPP